MFAFVCAICSSHIMYITAAATNRAYLWHVSVNMLECITRVNVHVFVFTKCTQKKNRKSFECFAVKFCQFIIIENTVWIHIRARRANKQTNSENQIFACTGITCITGFSYEIGE